MKALLQVLVLILLLVPCCLWAQHDPSRLTWDSLLKESTALFYQDQFDSLLKQTDDLATNPPQRKKRVAIGKWADIMRLRGITQHTIGKFDSGNQTFSMAKRYLEANGLSKSPQTLLIRCAEIRHLFLSGNSFIAAEQVKQLWPKWENRLLDHPARAYLLQLKGDQAFYSYQQREAEKWYIAALTVHIAQGPYLHPREKTNHLIYLAHFYGWVGQVALAAKYVQEATDWNASYPTGPYTEANLLMLKADQLTQAQRSKEAFEVIQQAIQLLDSYEGVDLFRANLYSSLGNACKNWAPQTAIDFFGQTFRLSVQYTQFPKGWVYQGVALAQIGLILLKLDETAKADSCFKESEWRLDSAAQYDALVAFTRTSILAEWGATKVKMDQYKQAVGPLEEAVTRTKKLFGNDPGALAHLLNNLALAYRNLGKDKKAVQMLREILRLDQVDWSKSAPFAESRNPIVASYVLWNLAETLTLHAERDSSQDLYQSAWTSFHRYVEFLDEIRASYRSEGSKLGFAAENRIAYSRAVETYLATSPDISADSTLARLWTYGEKSKGMILLEALNQEQVTQFAGVPSHVIEREQSLAARAEQADLLFFKAQQNQLSSPEGIQGLSQQRYAAQQAYALFIDSIAVHFPEYYALKYQLEPISLSDARNMLDDSTAILSYFWAPKQLCLLLIRKDTTLFKTIAFHTHPLLSYIEQFRMGLWGYHTSPPADQTDAYLDSTIQALHTYGQLLYQALIKPVEAWLPQSLIVIPDGALGFIPFEALLSSKPVNPYNLKSYPYFIKSHEISYARSASLLYQGGRLKKSHAESLPFLGMAPFYLETKKDSSRVRGIISDTLRYSGLEVVHAKNLFGGKVFQGNVAQKQTFLTLAPSAQIIHLSTHGVLDTLSAWEFMLVFAPDSVSEGHSIMYLKEFYNLDLGADLVVLSACDAGLGKLNEGEGILSLARAFSFAGAQSVLTTLWRVDDQATAEVMQLFYDHLSKGLPKHAALAYTQRQYLSQTLSSERCHPYYWASFIMTGDVSPISP